MALKTIQYQTTGTCCALMNIIIEDSDNTIYDVEFLGGCGGNLEGIKHLIKGMNIDSVIERLKGIRCGSKATSCPDQIAQSLLQFKEKMANQALK